MLWLQIFPIRPVSNCWRACALGTLGPNLIQHYRNCGISKWSILVRRIWSCIHIKRRSPFQYINNSNVCVGPRHKGCLGKVVMWGLVSRACWWYKAYTYLFAVPLPLQMMLKYRCYSIRKLFPFPRAGHLFLLLHLHTCVHLSTLGLPSFWAFLLFLCDGLQKVGYEIQLILNSS